MNVYPAVLRKKSSWILKLHILKFSYLLIWKFSINMYYSPVLLNLNCSYPIWRGKTIVWDLADACKMNSWSKPYTTTIQTWQVAANKKDIWKILFEIEI